MNEACLIVLVGAPGSGKSTWADKNGWNAVHVSQDELIDAITPHGFDPGCREIYYQAEDAIARSAIRAGHRVIVDRTNRTRAHRERWLRMAREEGCPVMAVVMTTSADVCRARNSQRVGPRRLSEARMERMLEAMEPVMADEGFDSILLAKELVHEHCHQAR